jgi:hypothetical protein
MHSTWTPKPGDAWQRGEVHIQTFGIGGAQARMLQENLCLTTSYSE